MDKFKKRVKRRIIGLMAILISLIGIYLILFVNKDKISYMPEEIMSFNSGVLFSIGILLLIEIFKNYRSMKTEKELKKLYIKENDERRIMIMQKTGAIGINICILTFGFATMIAGFFNQIVFFTLLGTTLFTAIVKGMFKVYYYKKI